MGAKTAINSSCTASKGKQDNAVSKPTLPIILILGPPGSGKGTLCKELAADYNLHHLSVGDWLRAQTVAPIAGVPARINAYVARAEVVPEEVMAAQYGPGKEDDAPPPLTLYNCSKRNIATPESMKCQLMPALKAEIEVLSAKTNPYWKRSWRWHDRPKPKAVLLDNLISTLAHAEAAVQTLGADFPTLAIAVNCADDTAESRFVARGRGSDDAPRFRRRIARYRSGSAEVMGFLRERGTSVVDVSAEGESEDVYRSLLDALSRNETWLTEVGNEKKGCSQSSTGDRPLAAGLQCEAGVQW